MAAQLGQLARLDLIFPRLEAGDRRGVLRRFSRELEARNVVPDAERLFERLWEREQLGSTAIGSGIAIPHCKLDRLDRIVMAVAITPEPIDFEAADGDPVRLFFLLLSPVDAPAEHLKSLAAISRWAKNGQRAERILEQESAEGIYAVLTEDVT